MEASLTDAQSVAAQSENTLLSGSHEENCVTEPHTCEDDIFKYT